MVTGQLAYAREHPSWSHECLYMYCVRGWWIWATLWIGSWPENFSHSFNQSNPFSFFFFCNSLMQSFHFSIKSCLSYCLSLKSCLSCFKCSLTMYTICCSSFLPLWSHVGEYTIFIMQQQLEPKLLRSTQNKSHIDKKKHTFKTAQQDITNAVGATTTNMQQYDCNTTPHTPHPLSSLCLGWTLVSIKNTWLWNQKLKGAAFLFVPNYYDNIHPHCHIGWLHKWQPKW